MISVFGLSGLLKGMVGAIASAAKASIAVRPAAEEAKTVMQAEMAVETGAMRDSVTVTVSGNSAELGPTIRYAPYVNYGTYKDPPQDFVEIPSQVAGDGLVKGLLKLGGSW